EASKEVAFDDAVEAAALDLAVENAEIVDLPEEMIHEEVHRSIDEIEREIQMEWKDATAIAQAVNQKEVSAKELVLETIDKIEKL
ncbi:trigger factor, partial [Streptococcus ruminantium]|nr:trigger factor [Streptococcus ruminantium]